MKNFINKLVLACLFLGINVYTFAIQMPDEIKQAKTIRGIVTEQGTNEPLPGTSVYVKGTTIGTTSDVDGKYQLNVPSEESILVFSFIGKKTVEHPVRGMTVIVNIILIHCQYTYRIGKVIKTGSSRPVTINVVNGTCSTGMRMRPVGR